MALGLCTAGGGAVHVPPWRRSRRTGSPWRAPSALRWFEELLRVLLLILWHALLAAPLHLTRCRKTFFTADYLSGCSSRPLTRGLFVSGQFLRA